MYPMYDDDDNDDDDDDEMMNYMSPTRSQPRQKPTSLRLPLQALYSFLIDFTPKPSYI